MASITERKGKNGVSYLIRVFVEQDRGGSQKVKSMTWKPPKDKNGQVKMTDAQIKKELNRQATLFEESVRTGLVTMTGRTTFEEYSTKWLANAQIKPKTLELYTRILARINNAIGHIRLEKLQAHHLEAFYKNLESPDIMIAGQYAICKESIKVELERAGITRLQLSEKVGMSYGGIKRACAGDRTRHRTAQKIADALCVPVDSIFDLYYPEHGMCDSEILHHHRLICCILRKAKKERIVPYNVAIEHTDPPKMRRKESKYLTDTQAQQIVVMLMEEGEDIRTRTAILTLLYTGVRLGELCGLSWGDIDFDNYTVKVERASQYLAGVGVTEVDTKTASSHRTIKVPAMLIDILSKYRIWWLEQKLKNGTDWKGDEKQRLFIKRDGGPIFPTTVNQWIKRFCVKHDMPKFTAHTCRHTFATLQIISGVDIRTLQARTGHAKASTLLDIYSHAIRSAAEAAADALDDKLTPEKYRNA